MRKIYSFMVAAVAVFAAASCAKELPQENLPAGETVVYSASFDQDTKAVLNEAKLQSEWVAGDAITVLDGTKGWEFTTADAGANAEFTNSEGFGEYRPVLAVYPKGEWTANVAQKTVNANISQWQQAQAGTYHADAALAVAYSENNEFSFKNAHALLKFQVDADNVTHLYFRGNANEAITGATVVTLNADNTVSVVAQETSVECYAYHGDDDKYFHKGETYYVAIAPQVFAEGVTVSIKVNEGAEVVAKTTTKKVEAKRSTILDLGTIEYTAPEAPAWQIAGTFNGWQPTEMVKEGDYYVAKNVTGLNFVKKEEGDESANGFKFLDNGNWKGCGNNGKVAASAWEYVWNEGGLNIYVDGAAETDAYDVYLNSIAEGEAKFVVVPAGAAMPEDVPSGDDNTGGDNAGEGTTGWALPGGYNTWSTTTVFLVEEGAYYVAKNVTVMDGTEPGFKFQHAEFGWKGVGATTPLAVGEWHKLNGENNITLDGGNVAYDVYMTADGSQFQAVTAGSPAPEAPAVIADYWALIGSFTSWADEIVLAAEGQYLVAKGVTISATDDFKFRKNGDWNAGQRIAKGGLAAADTEYDFVDAGSGNMKVSAAGTYDVYVKSDLSKVYFMTDGKTPAQATQPDASNFYRFYVQNKVGWSTLNFYAWGGYTSASWPGDKMTDSATVEGYGECKYIEITKGVSVVNFIVNNGSKQTKDLTLSNSNVKKLANGDYVYILESSDIKQN